MNMQKSVLMASTAVVIFAIFFAPVFATKQQTLRITYVDIVVSAPTGKDWTGVYGRSGSSQSVDGEGSASYHVQVGDDTYFIVSAVFQKGVLTGDESWELSVSIVDSDGTTQESASTTADYGVVSVVWSCYIVQGPATPTTPITYPMLDPETMAIFSVIGITLFVVVVIVVIAVYLRRKKVLYTRRMRLHSTDEGPEGLLEQPKESPKQTILPKYCTKCGASIEGMKFCGQCGTSIEDMK